MGDVIGQRYEVYKYDEIKDIIPRRGEKVVFTGTEEYGDNIIELVADGTKTIEALFEIWRAQQVGSGQLPGLAEKLENNTHMDDVKLPGFYFFDGGYDYYDLPSEIGVDFERRLEVHFIGILGEGTGIQQTLIGKEDCFQRTYRPYQNTWLSWQKVGDIDLTGQTPINASLIKQNDNLDDLQYPGFYYTDNNVTTLGSSLGLPKNYPGNIYKFSLLMFRLEMPFGYNSQLLINWDGQIYQRSETAEYGWIPWRQKNISPYTFTIDSDERLAAWANNAPGNDYSRILIKAGEWTLNTTLSGSAGPAGPLPVIDISDGRTKSVVGEAGSKIVINNTSSAAAYICGIKGNVSMSFPNFTHPGTDYFIRDVNIEVKRTGSGIATSVGFYYCSNLTNCTSTGTGYGTGTESSGFNHCVNLNNCIGTGISAGTGSVAVGFRECINLINCIGTANGNTMGGTTTGFYYCINLNNCIGTGIGSGGSGFNQCRVGFGCKNGATPSSYSVFTSCYMERTGTTNAWDMTANGGWNDPT